MTTTPYLPQRPSLVDLPESEALRLVNAVRKNRDGQWPLITGYHTPEAIDEKTKTKT